MIKNAFLVTTYNRPETCLRLLQSIAAVYSGQDVVVVDDASFEDYTAVKALVAERQWTWVQHAENHGRMRYVQTVNDGLAELQSRTFQKLYFLQDDVCFTPEQHAAAESAWKELPARLKGSLVLYTPEGAPVPPAMSAWTNRPMEALVEGVLDEVHHIDTSGIFSAGALKAIHFQLPLPDMARFNKPQVSSGFGLGISQAFAAQGYRMYRSVPPLIQTFNVASKMHPQERLRNPRGAATASAYLFPVIATMATFPGRLDCLPTAVESLLPQVDHLFVWCNNFTEVPACLKHPKITARLADRDLADNGKFAFDEDLGTDPVYHFTCDDDLRYPDDYVARLVLTLETGNREIVVSAHGRNLPGRVIRDFYKETTPIHCLKDNMEHRQVDLPGTGVMAYFTGHVRFSLDDFPEPRMADIWAGIKLNKAGVCSICIPHRAGWLTLLRTTSETIFDTEYRDSSKQAAALNRALPWFRPEAPMPGVSYSGVAFWDHQAKARNKACVIPEEWSYSEAAKHRPAFTKLIRRLLQSVPPGKKILDFGCGFGRWADVIRGAGYEYQGVDISRNVLSLDPDPSRTLYVTGAPLPKADAIFVFDVFQHMPLDTVRKLRGLFKQAAPALIVVERARAIGVEGDERTDYAEFFPGIMDCDSLQTHRLNWSGYRGKLR